MTGTIMGKLPIYEGKLQGWVKKVLLMVCDILDEYSELISLEKLYHKEKCNFLDYEYIKYKISMLLTQ